MCRSLRLYYRFVVPGNRENLTLEDYTYLFRRTICLDIVMAIVYGILGITQFLQTMAMAGLSQWINVVSLVMLLLVIAFWVADAILVGYLKNMVHTYEHEPSAPDCVITWLWVAVGSSIAGILVYIVRIGLEIMITASLMHDKSSSWVAGVGVIVGVLYLSVKVLRVFAFASFRSWIREHWSSKSTEQSSANTV